MSKVWAWIFGIAIALCILGLMAYGRSERQAYWAARGVMVHQAPDSRPAGREVAVRASEPVNPYETGYGFVERHESELTEARQRIRARR